MQNKIAQRPYRFIRQLVGIRSVYYHIYQCVHRKVSQEVTRTPARHFLHPGEKITPQSQVSDRSLDRPSSTVQTSFEQVHRLIVLQNNVLSLLRQTIVEPV